MAAMEEMRPISKHSERVRVSFGEVTLHQGGSQCRLMLRLEAGEGGLEGDNLMLWSKLDGFQ